MSKRLPYRDSSVARDLLQPHQRDARSGTVINTTRSVTEQVIEETIERTVGAKQERHSEQRLMKQVVQAERRAKHYAAGFNRAFRWQINQNKTVTTATWDPIAFDHEVLRTPGAQSRGNVTLASGTWELRGLKRNTGRWFIDAEIMLKALVGMAITKAWLGFFRNGVLWSSMQAVDVGYAGENPILDIVLKTSDIIPLEHGDVIDVRIFLDAGGGAGDQLILAPSSIQGRVIGFRTECDTTRIGATTSGTGFGYTFTI